MLLHRPVGSSREVARLLEEVIAMSTLLIALSMAALGVAVLALARVTRSP